MCLSGDLNLSADATSLPHVVIAEFYPTFSMLGIQVATIQKDTGPIKFLMYLINEENYN